MRPSPAHKSARL